MAASLQKIAEVQEKLETLQLEVTTLKKELQKRDGEETKPDVEIDTTALLLGTTPNKHRDLYLLDRRENFFKKLSLKLPGDIIPVSVVHLNDSIYVVGGKEGFAKTLFRLTDQFGWEQLADLNIPRKSVEKSCVALNGWILVAKGEDAKGKKLDTVEKYDPESNTWVVLPKSHCACNYSSATALDGKLFVSSRDRVECFDPATEIWTVLDTISDWDHVELTSYKSDLLAINSSSDGPEEALVWNTSATNSLYSWNLFSKVAYRKKYGFVVFTEGKTIWIVGGDSWNSAHVYNGDRWLEIRCLPDSFRPDYSNGPLKVAPPRQNLSLTMIPKKIGDELIKIFT